MHLCKRKVLKVKYDKLDIFLIIYCFWHSSAWFFSFFTWECPLTRSNKKSEKSKWWKWQSAIYYLLVAISILAQIIRPATENISWDLDPVIKMIFHIGKLFSHQISNNSLKNLIVLIIWNHSLWPTTITYLCTIRKHKRQDIFP